MPVHSKKPRRRLTAPARREEILEAALTVFGHGGYHSTHVDHVIREAGVARGTFYLHFKSKHDVFAALVDRMLGIFLTVRPSEPEPDVKGASDAEAVLRLSYRSLFETFRRHRRLCRLLFDEAVGLDKGFAGLLERHFRAWHERVRGTLRYFVQRGAARRDLDLDITADLVLGMVERLTRRHLVPEKAPDLGRLVDAVVTFEMRGIRAGR
jgi:AcrR family transcriptional regulator